MSEGDTKHVVVSDELVAELRAAPSRPVTLRIAELKGGQLEFVATEHRCAGERGSPPGDTPAPDLAKLQSVIEGALLEWTRGDPNDLLTDEEWARTVAQFLAARLCNAGSHAVFFEGGAAAGSSAPPECESCHALRNQLQTAQTKLRIRERGVREEPPAP